MRRLRVADVSANVAHRLVDVAVGDDEIEQAVEIGIDEGASESERIARCDADARCGGDVVVYAGLRRAIQADHLVVEIRDGDSRAAGILEVSDIHAHACACFAVGAKGESRFDGHILEFSVAEIAIQLVGLCVVGDEQVGPTVVVEIEHRHAERFGIAVENAAACRDVFKRAVAAIVKEPGCVAAIGFGRAIGFVN